LKITDRGSDELDKKIVEIQNKWKEMQSIYESGDKQKLQQKMEENKSFLPTMMFFGVMDMMMFSMMFSMMGIGMSNFVGPENMPAESMEMEVWTMEVWTMEDLILISDSKLYFIKKLQKNEQ